MIPPKVEWETSGKYCPDCERMCRCPGIGAIPRFDCSPELIEDLPTGHPFKDADAMSWLTTENRHHRIASILTREWNEADGSYHDIHLLVFGPKSACSWEVRTDLGPIHRHVPAKESP